MTRLLQTLIDLSVVVDVIVKLLKLITEGDTTSIDFLFSEFLE